jgi:hypothetical protein
MTGWAHVWAFLKAQHPEIHGRLRQCERCQGFLLPLHPRYPVLLAAVSVGPKVGKTPRSSLGELASRADRALGSRNGQPSRITSHADSYCQDGDTHLSRAARPEAG